MANGGRLYSLYTPPAGLATQLVTAPQRRGQSLRPFLDTVTPEQLERARTTFGGLPGPGLRDLALITVPRCTQVSFLNKPRNSYPDGYAALDVELVTLGRERGWRA